MILQKKLLLQRKKFTVTGRKILDDVTWLIGPGDRFGIRRRERCRKIGRY